VVNPVAFWKSKASDLSTPPAPAFVLANACPRARTSPHLHHGKWRPQLALIRIAPVVFFLVTHIPTPVAFTYNRTPRALLCCHLKPVCCQCDRAVRSARPYRPIGSAGGIVSYVHRYGHMDTIAAPPCTFVTCTCVCDARDVAWRSVGN
jgi:hypothetical protein